MNLLNKNHMLTLDVFVAGMETHRDVSIGSEICEQEEDGIKHHAGDRIARTTSAGDGCGPLVSLFELAPIVSSARRDHGRTTIP